MSHLHLRVVQVLRGRRSFARSNLLVEVRLLHREERPPCNDDVLFKIFSFPFIHKLIEKAQHDLVPLLCNIFGSGCVHHIFEQK
jgi:hypothetical protein